MKLKLISFLIVILFVCLPSVAEKQEFYSPGQCAVYTHDGNVFVDTINYMSTRAGKMGFNNYGKIKLHRIWMLNFMNKQWDFAQERRQLAPSTDTVILRNGRIIHDRVITFSIKFKRLRFEKYKEVHVSEVKRVYFCCNKLPAAYANKKKKKGPGGGPAPSGTYYTYLADGKIVDSPIKYINKDKTGFHSGLQINTKDIRMINFMNKRGSFSQQLKQMNRRTDTVILRNGKTINKEITFLDVEKWVVEFDDDSQMSFDKIGRLYFREGKFGGTPTHKRLKVKKIKRRF